MNTTLVSQEDRSVNFVTNQDGSIVESRYVRRSDDYFICYLSSHDGCRMGCRFCHLTATKQASFRPVSLAEYVNQAESVFAHYDAVKGAQGSAKRVHFNFMARGEALANPNLVGDYRAIREALETLALRRDLVPRFNVSTIMPKSYGGDLSEFDGHTRIYYSLYGLDSEFRRKWLPNAMPPERALDLLAAWQHATNNMVVLHWAFIAGVNDDEKTISSILDEIDARGIRAKFNLVRYNPYSSEYGSEPAEETLQRNFDLITARLRAEGSRIVPRVGFDVKASCGMFVNS